MGIVFLEDSVGFQEVGGFPFGDSSNGSVGILQFKGVSIPFFGLNVWMVLQALSPQHLFCFCFFSGLLLLLLFGFLKCRFSLVES